MTDKNEHISLWILDRKRGENKAKVEEKLARQFQDEKFHCLKCKKSFGEPKLVQYYACPHCLSKFEEEEKKDCQRWFGFLSQKEKNEPMPSECIECERVLECMLISQNNSASAVSEIKKWY